LQEKSPRNKPLESSKCGKIWKILDYIEGKGVSCPVFESILPWHNDCLVDTEYGFWVINVVESGHIRSRLIPDPAVKHCDFGQLKPQVGRLIIQSSIYDQIVDFFKENQHSSKKIQRTIDDYLSYLSPGNPEETIYFGVSRKARKEDLEGVIIPFIREELKGLKEASRFRSDKWNIYLIVYDLRCELS